MRMTFIFFLVTDNNEILWRTTGEYTPEKAQQLTDIIQRNR
jgi:hypothetical protein